MESNYPQLPKGWVWSKVSDIVDNVVVGFVGKSTPHYVENSGIPFFTGKDIKPNRIDMSRVTQISHNFHHQEKKSQLHPGDVVIVRIGNSGRAAVIPDELPVSNCGGLVIIKRPLAVLPEYLAYYFNSPNQQNWAKIESRGVTRGTLNTKKIADMQVPLPPLAEQSRIVALIEKSLTRINVINDELDRTRQRIEHLWRSILSNYISGKLTESWRINQRIDHEWRFLKMGDLGEWYGGGTPSRDLTDYWSSGTIRWASSGDVKKIWLDDTEERITEKGLADSSAKILPKGSLLIVTRSGILKRILPISVNLVDIAINQDIKGLIPKKGLNVNYLLFSIMALEEKIRNDCVKEGTTVESIEFKKMMNFSIPIPCEHEQNEIVRCIGLAINNRNILTNEVESCRVKIEQCGQSILNQAFMGILIPQDPNDEPAPLLLEKMKNEKLKRFKEKKEMTCVTS